MHTCPYCQQPGITGFRKICSITFVPGTIPYVPAVCEYCHQRSYLDVMHGLYALGMWILLTWVFIGVALVQQKSIYLIGTIPALMFAVDKFMLKAPLSRVPG
jgi:hypothetical protein